MKYYAQRNRQREGITLIEVLVAIFIMGIGTIAVLALFPLGVLRMSQALKDQRSASAVANAKAYANMLEIRHDSFIDAAFDTPGTDPRLQRPDANEPSYPVFVDPIGYRSSNIQTSRWLAGLTGTVPRRSLEFIESGNNAQRRFWVLSFFTFRDDLVFDKVGRPAQIPAAPGVIERDIIYSWAYLLQRPRASVKTVVETSVVVYNKRSTYVDSDPSLLPESLYPARFDLSQRSVELSHSAGQKLPVAPGNWIMDVSLVPHTTTAGSFSSMHGFFYRVTDVTNTSRTTTEIAVDAPLRGFAGSRIARDQFGLYVGRVIILEGVSEVFEVGVGPVQ